MLLCSIRSYVLASNLGFHESDAASCLEVMRCTTDTEPCWMHTVTGDCFNRVIDF